MKKYKATDKHPVYKSDILIQSTPQSHFNLYFFNKENKIFFNHLEYSDFAAMLEDGWIEEIQEPEFTKGDMIEFAAQCIDKLKKDENLVYKEEIEKYLNER